MEKDFQKIVRGLQHVGLPTNSIEETIAFYEMLGFEKVYETLNKQANERVAFLKQGSLVIETYENKQAVLKEGAWDHIALDVTDIEEAFRLAKEKGLFILDQGIRSLPFWENGVSFFTILGPNKEKVEFCQRM